MDFRDLPNELNEHIASFMEDSDLCRFTLVCQHTCNTVRGDGSGIWRKLFKRHFDLVPTFSKRDIRSIYQDRRKWLRKGAKFLLGKTGAEIECLRVIRDLIVESYTGNIDKDQDGEAVSNNLQWLVHFVRNHGILQEMFVPRNDNRATNPLLHTIRVMLSHINLDHRLCGETYGFHDSQIMAYRSSIDQPIFLGPTKQRIDMLYVLHLLNFFKYHMTRKHEYTLFDEYTAMDDLERPQAWRNRIKPGTSRLGRYWKGTYSYISSERDFFQMRSYATSEDEEAIIADEFNGFQDLEIEFPGEEGVHWPHLFEDHLHAFPPAPSSARARTPAQGSTANGGTTRSKTTDVEWKNVPFRGVGADTESFLATGWLNPLPAQPVSRSSPPTTSTPSSRNLAPTHRATHRRTLRSSTTSGSSATTHNLRSSSSSSVAVPIPGIPGFQRLTMMKYYLTPDGTYDTGALWAYEGVVLPGGMLIVGRWWNASDERGVEESFSGPFILWNVDASVEKEENENWEGDGEGEDGV